MDDKALADCEREAAQWVSSCWQHHSEQMFFIKKKLALNIQFNLLVLN